jgi:dihydroorotate dehydrogenase electron transfer subunit
MRLATGILNTNTEILPGGRLLEVQAPQLVRSVQPGQYCMLRCCASEASDPLLRRPFFVASREPERGTCGFLIYERGRGSRWLTKLQAGMELDILGPLGRGWTLRPQVRNLLLIGEEPLLGALLSLVRSALEAEIAVTLLHFVNDLERAYPPALLPPEIEYSVVSGLDKPKGVAAQLADYLTWADAASCSVTAATLEMLVSTGSRWREKSFAQVILAPPLPCASGACLACQVETRQRSRLVCCDGPVFALSELIDF